MTRREHLKKLARTLNVTLSIRKDATWYYMIPSADKIGRPRGWYSPEGHTDMWLQMEYDPAVVIERWDARQQISYFTGLHELGHAANKHPLRDWSTPRAEIMEQEVQAWEWAFAHAQEEPTEETLRIIFDEMLGSYVQEYGHAYKVEALAASIGAQR